MEYRVMIDALSPLATKHAEAARSVMEVQEKDGDCSTKHPVLHCSQIDLSHPTFLRVHLPLGGGKSGPTLWIPYGHVLGILTVAEDVTERTVGEGELSQEPTADGVGYGAQPSVH